MVIKKELIQELCLFDDALFGEVARHIPAMEELVSICLKKNIKLVEIVSQRSFRNLLGRSVVLDLYCKDERGKIFHVEIQRSNDTDFQKRMRYNRALIDTECHHKGADYRELPEIYSLLISEFDVLKKGEMLYYIDRIERNSKEIQNNGIHEIYINAKNADNSRYGHSGKTCSRHWYRSWLYSCLSAFKQYLQKGHYD